MQTDKGPEKLADLIKKQASGKLPTYAWQDLALEVIKELNIPEFKRSAVFKACKQNPRAKILVALNDTKELCRTGQKWKYFFKIIGL
ncbi:MAG: hypothetical protein AUK20_00740 [Parcubacteria group bacterium CG2_30_45_37]|nr:MAG: hypothetical protein AUK20_00740 [Parcubacteria group bacterium CG2_30_45_37]